MASEKIYPLGNGHGTDTDPRSVSETRAAWTAVHLAVSSTGSHAAILPGAVHAIRAPAPETLEREIGYPGNARFVCLYWDAEQKAHFDDGQTSGTIAWSAFTQLLQHRDILPDLKGFNVYGDQLGKAPRHHLVLDRNARRLFLVAAEASHDIVIQQWADRARKRLTWPPFGHRETAGGHTRTSANDTSAHA